MSFVLENAAPCRLPRGHFEILDAPVGKRLFEQDARTDVDFPLGAVISLIRNLEDGDALEVCMIGSEGLAGINEVLGVATNPVEGVIQGSGLVASIGGKALGGRWTRTRPCAISCTASSTR
jgi:hypothetical protein